MEKSFKGIFFILFLKKQYQKAINLMDYLAKNGSPRCVGEFKDEMYQLRTLQDFSLYEQNIDRGASSKMRLKTD